MSVLTPSVPERASMLAEAEASVTGQTYREWEHLVLVDDSYIGCARTVNQLAKAAQGDWLLILADDDLLQPDCLTLHLAASADTHFVYSPPLVEGEPPETFHGDPPAIPSLSLILKEVWDHLQGYDETLTCREDRNLYERALELGYRFKRIPEQTWTYRFHENIGGGNKSRGGIFGPRPG